MAITGEAIGFVIALCTLVGFLWRIFSAITGMKDELKREIINVRNELEKKDMALESLVDKSSLGINGLSERMNHIATRLKAEMKELQIKVNDLEGFMIKTTEYKERDYGSSHGMR